jgi:hypothetical protein
MCFNDRRNGCKRGLGLACRRRLGIQRRWHYLILLVFLTHFYEATMMVTEWHVINDLLMNIEPSYNLLPHSLKI